jgi:hypothetical protein
MAPAVRAPEIKDPMAGTLVEESPVAPQPPPVEPGVVVPRSESPPPDPWARPAAAPPDPPPPAPRPSPAFERPAAAALKGSFYSKFKK